MIIFEIGNAFVSWVHYTSNGICYRCSVTIVVIAYIHYMNRKRINRAAYCECILVTVIAIFRLYITMHLCKYIPKCIIVYIYTNIQRVYQVDVVTIFS